MRKAVSTTGIGGVVVLVLGLAATALLGSTLVLGLTGDTTAVTWTGTTGCVSLAGWLLAVNGHARSRAAGSTSDEPT